jgi:DNA-binding NarL/FixJ family response regulator
MAPKQPPAEEAPKALTQSQVDDIVMNIMQPRPNMLDATLEAAALKVVILTSKNICNTRSFTSHN